MSGPEFVSIAAVREMLALNSSDATSKYSDATIGSNIRAASWKLQRDTGRQFVEFVGTKTFSTDGRTLVDIPGLRTPTSVVLNGASLVQDETYHLIPDVEETGVYVAIQFRSFEPAGGRLLPWWYGSSEWFDRGYDLPNGPHRMSSNPNDLLITGTWGYTPANYPEPLLLATKALAAYYTLRPSALLSGASVTPEGSAFDLSDLPVEARDFILAWKLGARVVSV
jgi:hypothetical protein